MPALHALHEQYRDRVEFFLVYIREAHPRDAWQLSSNVRDGVVHDSPRTLQERCAVADACAADLAIPFGVLVDGLDDATEQAYTAWPERLFLVGVDGRIEYLSGPGPFGFEPDALGEALARVAPVEPSR